MYLYNICLYFAICILDVKILIALQNLICPLFSPNMLHKVYSRTFNKLYFCSFALRQGEGVTYYRKSDLIKDYNINYI